ncbi:type VI secretion system baseplate subunit TssG [Mangrovicoccus algicola]|uniref:Type VI secretion system baseplate subunit TssG n=1 Tax=Mangrovicoccus algicola TaxID=2771008 RepID=A0A8J6ZBB1_9RHOB|nr:type VI secretion system baseplate subunit TssG [Mangrovicoccus algicola]MBE3639605.1 type VI secretion system baseplate subunit TssG [Mangrovicoccus algicola]
MAPESREGAADLTHYAQFADDPRSYHILLALRLLEARLQAQAPLGRTRLPSQDGLRLGQDPELAFPASAISGFVPAAEGRPAQLRNLAFGFWGPQGPLPLHLTEYARERLRDHRDPTLAAFADMLTHRMMSLFYRAWAEAQPAPGMDRGTGGGGFEARVAAIAGVAGRAMAGRDALPDLARRHFAGLLSQGPKNAEGLRQLLAAQFGAGVEVEEFRGSWLELSRDDRWQMGRAGLGRGTVIGSRVWSRSAKIRIRLGPLDLAGYCRMLPGGDTLAQLAAAVRSFAGLALDFDLNLVLRREDVPRACLGRETRLGQTSWLGRRRAGGDAGDLVLAPPAAAPIGAI